MGTTLSYIFAALQWSLDSERPVSRLSHWWTWPPVARGSRHTLGNWGLLSHVILSLATTYMPNVNSYSWPVQYFTFGTLPV